MTRSLKWVPTLMAAVLLNALLLAAAALLSRERPMMQDLSDPVAVNLISIKETPPPRKEKPREIPKPKPKPKVDFMPELVKPSLVQPQVVGLSVKIDPSLLQGSLDRSEFIFNSGDLDQPPRPVVRTEPVYPYRARQRNIQGEVKVKLLIQADGSIGSVEILAARPEGIFEEAVLKAVPQWRFSPGTIDGNNVPAWVVTTVRFQPDK